MVSKKLLDELKIILKEEYGVTPSNKELAQFANGIVGYFNLTSKINKRNSKENEYETSSTITKRN